VHGAVALSELSASLATTYFTDVRAYSRQSWAISASEDDSLLRQRWLEGESTWNAQMQSNALQRGWTG